MKNRFLFHSTKSGGHHMSVQTDYGCFTFYKEDAGLPEGTLRDIFIDAKKDYGTEHYNFEDGPFDLIAFIFHVIQQTGGTLKLNGQLLEPINVWQTSSLPGTLGPDSEFMLNKGRTTLTKPTPIKLL